MILRKRVSIVGLAFITYVAAIGVAAENPGGTPPTAPASAPTTGHALRKIIVSESVEVARTFVPAADSGFVVLSPSMPSFDVVDLNKRFTGGENRIIEERLLAAIAQVLENFFRQNGYPTATVVVPTQNIAGGMLRVLAQLGPTGATLAERAKTTPWKIRNINISGERWFSESLLREKLRIDQGSIVKYAELDQAINWTNNSPFRRVRVKLDPVPNTDEADLTIAVQDALPLRLAVMYDNAGNEIIGQNRFVASLSYANLWGKDHEASYQFVTSDETDVFQGHGFDYRVPLPWRHHLQLSTFYLHATPELIPGLLLQDGETFTADLRYTMPLRGGLNPVDLYTALSFKETNNNLTWDPQGTPDFFAGVPINVFQLTTGLSGVRRDKRGAWGFGANFTFSPGGINSRNKKAAFEEAQARADAEPCYIYGNISIQRLLNLKEGWDISARGVLQISDGNLLPSEQMSIGGGSSVRGYRENLFSGDQAFVINVDLLTPALKHNVPYFSKTRGPLATRFLVFYDGASSEAKHPFLSDAPRKPLASTGLGMRMSLANNFSLSADYGWQLTRLPYEVHDHARGHIKVMLSY